jgi:DNA-binding XRE family transcriptional regulator
MNLADLDNLIANTLDHGIKQSAIALREKLTQNMDVTPVLAELDILITNTFDTAVREMATKLRDRLMQRPMAEILNAVPGQTVTDKAKCCQVSRQTFYSWERGAIPNPRQAKRLAEVTGYSVAEVRGSSAPSPPASRAPAAPGIS